jgi:amino acid permease
MTHDTQKEIQKASLIGRILSTEAFLLLMGVASLVYGIANGTSMNIFWGLVIIPGVFILYKIRQKDWTKHWQEMEAEHKMQEEYEARRKNAADEARKAANDEK